MIILFIFLSAMIVRAIEVPEYVRYDDRIYKEGIHTLLAYKEGWELSYPIIKLNSAERVVVCFDDLAREEKQYIYTVVHCDLSWKRSELDFFQYAEGYQENTFMNVRPSFNTTLHYYHYSVTLPNDDVVFTKPGNYILYVYEDYNTMKPVLTKRFFVVESNSSVKADVKRATLPEKASQKQEVDVTVTHYSDRVFNPSEEIKLVITKNNRWKHAIKDLEPSYIDRNKLTYNYQKGNVFWGGNEYLHFNSKNLDYPMENIVAIEYEAPYYHFLLEAEEDRTYKPYRFEEEKNGKYFVEGEVKENRNITANYVYVHFRLKYDVPLLDGDVCVFGALSNWRCDEGVKMSYNYEDKVYESALLLKQGYYNYKFVYKRSQTGEIDDTFFSGSHYQTENDYVIFVYETLIGGDYDRLIGAKVINSMEKRD